MTLIFALVLGMRHGKGSGRTERRRRSGVHFRWTRKTPSSRTPISFPGNLSGTIELDATLPLFGGTCDSTFTLKGTPYTGYCPGCTFNFEVVSARDARRRSEVPAARAGAGDLLAGDLPALDLVVQHRVPVQPVLGRSLLLLLPSEQRSRARVGRRVLPGSARVADRVRRQRLRVVTDVTNTTIDWTIDWSYYDMYYGTGLNEIHAVGARVHRPVVCDDARSRRRSTVARRRRGTQSLAFRTGETAGPPQSAGRALSTR